MPENVLMRMMSRLRDRHGADIDDGCKMALFQRTSAGVSGHLLKGLDDAALNALALLEMGCPVYSGTAPLTGPFELRYGDDMQLRFAPCLAPNRDGELHWPCGRAFGLDPSVLALRIHRQEMMWLLAEGPMVWRFRPFYEALVARTPAGVACGTMYLLEPRGEL